MERPDPPDIAEVYRAESQLAANRVVDTLLQPEGIPAILGDHTDHALHGIGQPGDVIIFVPVEHKERALQIIAEARDNGYLDAEDGEVSVKPV